MSPEALTNILGLLFSLLAVAAVSMIRNFTRAGKADKERAKELNVSKARTSALETWFYAAIRVMAKKNVYPPPLPPELAYLVKTDDVPDAGDENDPTSPAALLRAFIERERGAT